jgi:uncharacterized protein YdeI (YjbR/CyaY-like superfamily)
VLGCRAAWAQQASPPVATTSGVSSAAAVGAAAPPRCDANCVRSNAGAEVPDDLQKALNKNPKAAAFLATLNSKNRFAILYRIGTVKKAETRTRKIAQFVAMLERGETIHG